MGLHLTRSCGRNHKESDPVSQKAESAGLRHCAHRSPSGDERPAVAPISGGCCAVWPIRCSAWRLVATGGGVTWHTRCRNADGDRRTMDPLFLPLLFIVVLAVPLIMNARRQKRAIADAQRLQSSLTNGDRVVTTSGLYATVVGTTDEMTVDLEIAPGVRTRWLRAAIREKLSDDRAGDDKASSPLTSPGDGSRTNVP